MTFEPGKAYIAQCDQGLAWMEPPSPSGSPRRRMRIAKGQVIVCIDRQVDERRMELSRFLVQDRTTGWVPLREEFIVCVGDFFKEM